jgi:secreted Zn-dependent insulinase-like peptidase
MPGLAHFLEHAVHLGSEAFPDEREYKAYLAQHGGASNASTSARAGGWGGGVGGWGVGVGG